MTIAYLDPGSGSLIISAVVGGAAAAGVAVKQARSRVAGAFRRKPRSAEAAAEPTATAQTVPAAEPAGSGETPVETAAPGDSA